MTDLDTTQLFEALLDEMDKIEAQIEEEERKIEDINRRNPKNYPKGMYSDYFELSMVRIILSTKVELLKEMVSRGYLFEVSDGVLEWQYQGEIVAMPDLPEAYLLTGISALEEAIQQEQSLLSAFLAIDLAFRFVETGRPGYVKYVTSILNRIRSRKPREKPRLGTRAIQIALRDGGKSTDDVREYFDRWAKPLDDKWGTMSVQRSDDFDGWELLDEDSRVSRDIKRTSLASLVSRAKKNPKRPR